MIAKGKGSRRYKLFAISVLSLNLHGYHPTKEARRFLQDRAGKITETTSDLYYFTEAELDRGHRKRLDSLAIEIERLKPTFAFFQEVGASSPHGRRNCDSFTGPGTSQPGEDAFGRNAALRLQDRLTTRYQLLLACRGNVGWITRDDSFHEKRIVRKAPSGFEIVHDFDSNPYPGGIIVEGFAMLVSAEWTVEHQETVTVETNYRRDTFTFQLAQVRNANGRAIVLVNIHAAHKLAHFEQAVAMREYLERRWPDYDVIVAGDFNAQLYRPGTRSGEVSTVAWEVSRTSEFDFTASAAAEGLERALTELNQNLKYKEWASVKDPGEASRRIRDAVTRFYSLPNEARRPLAEALSEFHPPAPVPPEKEPRGIDHVFYSLRDRTLRESRFKWEDVNTWRSLDGISDHPGTWAVFD